MWKLFKSQISYNKTVIIIGYILLLAVFLPFVIDGWRVVNKSYPALRAIMFTVTMIVFLASFVKNIKEKRDRFFHKLPLNIWELGISRLFFILVFWCSILLIVTSAFVIRKSIFNFNFLWDLLSQTGFIIFMIGAVFFVRDITFVFNFKNKKIIAGALNFTIILCGYMLFMLFVASKNAVDISPSLIPVKNGFDQLITTCSGSVLFLALGAAMFFLSIIIFFRRKTFLE